MLKIPPTNHHALWKSNTMLVLLIAAINHVLLSFADSFRWYKRVENNGWRIVSDKLISQITRSADPLTLETSSKKFEFRHSKVWFDDRHLRQICVWNRDTLKFFVTLWVYWSRHDITQRWIHIVCSTRGLAVANGSRGSRRGLVLLNCMRNDNRNKVSPVRDWRSTPLEWISSTRDLDLDFGSGHTSYCRASVIELYLHIKFHWNRKKLCGGRTIHRDPSKFKVTWQKLGQISKIQPDQM